MTLRRFNGWEPVETHIHRDANGVYAGQTTIIRQPEWDDEQRTLALELLDYERGLCPGCGGHYTKTRDNTVARDVQNVKSVCLDCEAISTVRQAHHAKHGGSECDCHERAVWVDKHVPIPERK